MRIQRHLHLIPDGFSALQRAENSSIIIALAHVHHLRRGFSALQRAENSSILRRRHLAMMCPGVSVLFSEPKIPQFLRCRRLVSGRCGCVSVLFSEPKIPQFENVVQMRWWHGLFQCSSASRKFLNSSQSTIQRSAGMEFQCSSASRKFLNS